MDTSLRVGIVFQDVAEHYTIRQWESIPCYYTVLPSCSTGSRDTIGIYKIGWRHTTECLVFCWIAGQNSPDMIQTETQCVLFDGEKLTTAVQSSFSSLSVYYEFCYVDSSDRVQGRSKPFRLKLDSKSDICLSMMNDFSVDADDEEFVEIQDDENGEIVVIKPRVAFLEEELCKISATARTREIESAKLREENDMLLLQLDKIQQTYAKVLQDKEIMQKNVNELRQRLDAETSRWKERIDDISRQLAIKTEECDRLQNEISQYKVVRAVTSGQADGDGGAADANEETVVDASEHSPTGPSAASQLSSSPGTAEPADAAEPGAAASSSASDEAAEYGSLLTQRIRHPPPPKSLVLPDVAESCNDSRGSTSQSRAVSGSPPRVSYFPNSPTVVRFPSGGNQTPAKRRSWFGAAYEVGLNMFSHMAESMSQFAPDLGDTPDEMLSAVRHPPTYERLRDVSDNLSESGSGLPPCVMQPLPRTRTVSASASQSSDSIVCPLCYSAFSPGFVESAERQFIEHVVRLHSAT